MTKNELNLNDKWRVGRKAIAYLLISAIAGLMVLGTKSYIETEREITAGENSIELVRRLCDMDQTDSLLRRLGADEPGIVRQVLSANLDNQFRDVCKLLPAVDAGTRKYGEWVCNRILKAQRNHPEYYLVSSKSTGSAVSTTPGHGVDLPRAERAQNN